MPKGVEQDALARERQRFEAGVVAQRPAAWARFDPHRLSDRQPLAALAAVLEDPACVAELAACEAEERYPRQVLERLQAAGWGALLSEPAQPDSDDSHLTQAHLAALNALAARVDGALAITVGVNALALLPVWLAGTEEQRALVFERVREGALCSLLLTEIDQGSNLLGNGARAVSGRLDATGFAPGAAEGEEPTHYRLSGEKHLINGGREHDLLITLLRTRPAEPEAGLLRALGDHSVFAIDRDATCEPLRRWATHPARAADISGVRFRGTVVPASCRIGAEGSGFGLIKHTLTISRGGIASLASGAASRARDLALTYASRREVYGAPIAKLGGIAGHLLRLEALDVAVAAIALRAVSAVGAHALKASWSTAVAKLAACDLAEEAVREGARVLGARALLTELPYAGLSRDVTLYSVFDGTRHVMLDELATRLAEAAANGRVVNDPLQEARARYGAPPRRLVGLRARRTVPLPPDLVGNARALADLPGAHDLSFLPLLAERLLATVRGLVEQGAWAADQDLRFTAAAAAALFEAVLATVEVADPDRRRALGMSEPLPAADPARDAAVRRYAVCWLAARAAEQVEALAVRAGLTSDASLAAAARQGAIEAPAAYRQALEAAATGD